jgi:hypothetical protein
LPMWNALLMLTDTMLKCVTRSGCGRTTLDQWRSGMDEALWRREVIIQVVRGDTHWNALYALRARQASSQSADGTLIDIPDASPGLISVSTGDLISGFRRYVGIPNALRAWASALTVSATWELAVGVSDQTTRCTLLVALQDASHGQQLSANILAILHDWREGERQWLEQYAPT